MSPAWLPLALAIGWAMGRTWTLRPRMCPPGTSVTIGALPDGRVQFEVAAIGLGHRFHASEAARIGDAFVRVAGWAARRAP